jgi:hypothetical protein
MIEFPCNCRKHRFSLPDDMAGGLIQCPVCSRLNDVPLLGDLDQLDDEGVFKLEPAIDRHEPVEQRLAEVTRAFTRSHVDASGEEIDLRPSMDDVDVVGTPETIELADELPAKLPKYDPLTGELVRPLAVKGGSEPRVDPASIPMAQRVVQYEEPGDDRSRWGLMRLALQLCQPVNVFVMSIVLLAHVIMQPFVVMWAAGIFFVAPVIIIGLLFFLSHYGNVIDETGPGDKDELPRPLRDASLSDDIWRPFVHFAGSLIICFLPALVAARAGAPAVVLVGLGLFGTFFFPSVLLTMVTSGSSLNLRPDRVIGVIGVSGFAYYASGALFVGAVLLQGLGLWRFLYDFQNLFTSRPSTLPTAWWFAPEIAYPALLAGVFVMHWFSWSLGLLYRRYQQQFPWVLQRHLATKLKDRTMRRRPLPNLTANSARVRQKMQAPPAAATAAPAPTTDR